jgi:anti-sigma B factor antagonist
MAISTRIIKGVAILDLQGEMTFWKGSGELHNKVRELVDTGIRNILLNAQGVGEVDSSGIGEFVGSYTTVSNRGGHLKLLNLTDKLNQVIETTNLNHIFETYDNEQRAISSFL